MPDKALPVRLLKPAQADLIQIHRYIATDSPQNADQFISKLLTHIEKIGLMPLAGSIPKDQRLKKKGYRFIIHGEYLVFYKPFKTSVRVYRVIHGKRKYIYILL